MKRVVSWMALGWVIAAAGCARISTQVVEKPRVDQEITGNQGVLQGELPAERPRKSTRQYVEINVDLPTAQELNPWAAPEQEASAPQVAMAPSPSSTQGPQMIPISQEMEEELRPEPQEAPFEEEPSAPAAVQMYTVQKGDTLEKIAFSAYGDSKQWKRIFEANRESLKSPNRIYVGQKLIVPPMDVRQEGTKRAGLGSDFK